VTAAETGTAVGRIVLEVRNQAGTIVSRTVTNNAATGANYSYTGAAGSRYFVKPVPDRKQFSIPAHKSVPAGTSQDFQIRGIPAVVTVANLRPGTLVLLSRNASPWTGAQPPASNVADHISSTADSRGQAQLEVPSGTAYRIVCWSPVTVNAKSTYQRSPSGTSQGAQINGVASVLPRQNITASCP